jgi:guanyl-specific ribonuclease Sa
MKKVTSIFFSALIVAGALLCAGKDSSPARKTSLAQSDAVVVVRDGEYCSKDAVAEYIRRFGGALPRNYITKAQARAMGWRGGPLEPFAPGKSIGGDRFGNYERRLPPSSYKECDIDTKGKPRGAKRLVFTVRGERIYYTQDHYRTFEEIKEKK